MLFCTRHRITALAKCGFGIHSTRCRSLVLRPVLSSYPTLSARSNRTAAPAMTSATTMPATSELAVGNSQPSFPVSVIAPDSIAMPATPETAKGKRKTRTDPTLINPSTADVLHTKQASRPQRSRRTNAAPSPTQLPVQESKNIEEVVEETLILAKVNPDEAVATVNTTKAEAAVVVKSTRRKRVAAVPTPASAAVLELSAEPAAKRRRSRKPAPVTPTTVHDSLQPVEGNQVNTTQDASTAPAAKGHKPRKRAPAKATTGEELEEDLDESQADAPTAPAAKRRKPRKRAPVVAAAVEELGEHLDETQADASTAPAAKRRKPRKRAAAGVATGQESQQMGETQVDELQAAAIVAAAVPAKRITKKQTKADMRADILSSTFRDSVMLHTSYSHIASHVAVPYSSLLSDQPTNAPLPNLGYACLSMTLREFDVYSSRDCNKKTMEAKGLPHISQLALANVKDIAPMLEWNDRHGIKFMRLSSCIFPWMSFYNMEDLPDWPEIKKALEFTGETAKRLGHRLTFHPSEFTKIASDREEVVSTSIKELEVHSKVFDYMGFNPPTPFNKINIHVGGVYGDKTETLQRFAKVYHERLSDGVKRRLTVENDDRPSMFHVQDLMELHRMTGVPIVFDFHHHKFCPGTLNHREAFELAITTWPEGVRPVVHWSESQRGRRPHAHSDYIYGPIDLYGKEADVDVMVEAKAKELAVLRFRQLTAEGADPEASRAQYEEQAEKGEGLAAVADE